MTARCGPASLCRGATTVRQLHQRFQRNTMKVADCVDRTEQRMQGVGWLCGTHCWACLGLDCHEFRMQLQLHALCAAPGKNCQSCSTRDKWWEGDGCVDRTERVQLQPHAKLVAIQTEACPAVRSTQPANALHALLYTIHTVSRWNCRCNCLDCHEFSSTPLRFRPHPRMPMQLSFRPHPRMQLQLHTLCALSTTRLVCGNCLTVIAPRHIAAGPHRAVMGIK
jgi:hypothetical protein